MDNSILHFLSGNHDDLLVIYESVYIPGSEDPDIPFSHLLQPKALQLTTTRHLDPIYAAQTLGYSQEEVSFLMCAINHFVEIRALRVGHLTLTAKNCSQPHYHRELDQGLFQMHLSCLVPLLEIGDLLEGLLITDRVVVVDHNQSQLYRTFFINDLIKQAYQLSYQNGRFLWREFDLVQSEDSMIIKSRDNPVRELIIQDFT